MVARGSVTPALSSSINYCMTTSGGNPVARYIAAWRPSSVPPPAAAFARGVVTGCGPLSRDRAKCLLRAADKLARWGISMGLELVPEVLLHPSVIERFAAPGLAASRSRTAPALTCSPAGVRAGSGRRPWLARLTLRTIHVFD